MAAGEQEQTFAAVLKGLFEATRVDEYTTEANQYLFALAHHVFTLKTAKDAQPAPPTSKQIIPLCTTVIEAVIENICSVENVDMPKAADQLEHVAKDLLSMRNTGLKPHQDPATVLLHQLAARMASMCYEQSWQRKTGAALGISILSKKVGVDAKWLSEHEIEFIRALLFSLKDMPGESPSNADMVADTLLDTVRLCSGPDAREDTPAAKNQLDYLIGLLLTEVCSQIASVRKTVKKALQILSNSTGTPLTEMLTPVRDRLLTGIFTKPLRALGFTMQIGHIDAVTYCISLSPPLIDFDDQLSRLLHEALGIADAEDSALLGGKATTKTMAPLTQLRVVCVQLLSAALASPEFNNQAHHATRLKALSVYFKLLYSKAPEVVEASYQSLKQVMVQQGKLPKDLLQSGLKPVLMNLADHKKLSVASLQVRFLS